MPESSAWPDIQRWGHYNDHDDISEEHVVVHNELYISENDEEEILDHDDDDDDHHMGHGDTGTWSRQRDMRSQGHEDTQIVEVEILDESSDAERQSISGMSGISQQDRDNKTILLRQAASGKIPYSNLNLNTPFQKINLEKVCLDWKLCKIIQNW